MMQSLPAPDGLEALAASAAALPEEKRQHFLYLMQALLDCYRKDDRQAVVITANAADASTSLFAVSATESEVRALIGLVSQAMPGRDGTENAGPLN